ncbi:DUF2207 domain-containing protein [Lunatibacter salilacus]|uniref:DUF2207 domain-containing protein n=1 Tax=Lunatibacter salilacus TaxID=2483804 RepID=UPI00131D21B9|nr:DUF2207 domain-containing protein [Lunatibacter salilacus]
MRKNIVILLLSVVPYWANAQDQEVILEYLSDIEVLVDGSLKVKETITVNSLQNEIQRGIFRTFPVIYRDKYNNRVQVGFEVQSVLKDGDREPYEILTEGDFRVIRIGNPDVILDKGNYTYTIEYTTNRQIGFFEEFDELYWNVIGDSWAFPIRRATARIKLPPGAEIIQYAAYSGPSGSTGCDCEITEEGDETLVVTLKGSLKPHEALTVAVAWPKGIVEQPSAMDQRQQFFGDNLGILIALFGVILALGYYLFAWNKVGRDPKKGGIYPQFETPKELDAAATRYIYHMGFDQTAFTAAMIQLATRGIIKIVEEKRRRYVLQLLKREDESMDQMERSVVNALFPEGNSVITLNQKEHKKIGGALKAVQTYLNTNYKKGYFQLNQGWLVPGILLSIATVIFSLVATFPLRFEEERVFLIMGTVITLLLSGVVSNLLIKLYELTQGEQVKLLPLFGSLFSIALFLAVPVFLYINFGAQFEYGLLTLFMILGVTNYLFFYLIKAPTESGRLIMDEIEGFRMYLNAAEKPQIQQMNPPGLTPEIFEKFLPYAIALGVGEAWGKSFEKSLAVMEKNTGRSMGYAPAWYAGSAFNAGAMGGFSKGLGRTFSNVLNNSAAAPGSKSGSGGGGRSGGGGGGGGGGGW